ncbi:MAG: NAD-dependent DNA ligase LigA [Patescibacteria group bacterium]|nr:NAD-dependent DNA ligase LigA [Patescibacteria group bacterium]
MQELSKQEAKKRIEKLKKEIEYHGRLYYVLDKPSISDAAYDSLRKELLALENQYPEFGGQNSPTQRVGGKPLEKFKKFAHKIPLLSLSDVFEEKEIYDWEKRIKKLLPPDLKIDYFIELKMDGLAVALFYKNGIFEKGATRGDGYIGEDVTQNLKTIRTIPLKLEGNFQGEVEIRGEVFMSKKVFEELNKEQIKKGEAAFANPRNAAAGSLRQLDSQITLGRKLNFFAYDITTDLGRKTHLETHKLIEKIGFPPNPYTQYCADISEIIKFQKYIGGLREKLPYEIDGVVARVNSNEIYNKLGTIGRAPRGSIAYKFPGLEAVTKIKDIIIQIGRTGRLTPVAVLEPVNVGGATVSRATLHNEDEIKRLDVRIGDTVVIKRAGDVIPDIVGVLKNLRTSKEKIFRMPNHCPLCHSPAYRKEGEVDFYCSNKNCYGQRWRGITHFVSKNAFDIVHLGPKIIDKLFSVGLIKDPADIFFLKKEDLEPLERFAEKSAENIIGAIDKSKKIDFSRFIYALGIRHTGEETAINLANYFGDLDNLTKAKLEDLEAIEDIGGVVAKSIFEWFQDKNNLELIKKFKKAGIEIIKPSKISQKLNGKTFVLTGTLTHFTRESAKEMIRKSGGNISSSVSLKTDFLVAGEASGSKLKNAKDLGVKIISEQEFLKMVQ